MARRRVLVVDADESFVDWFRKALASTEIEIHVTDSADDALAKVRRLHDDIFFIAVDLPNKSGFGLFSRIKGLAKRARVVLATSTISPDEMLIHQNLRVHADAYLDKRTLDEEELIDTIDSLAGPESRAGASVSVEPVQEEGVVHDEEDVVHDEEGAFTIHDSEQHTTSHEPASERGSAACPTTAAGTKEDDRSAEFRRARELELEVDHLSQEMEDLRREAMKALQGKIDELTQRLDTAQRDKGEVLERDNEHKRSPEAAGAGDQGARGWLLERKQKLQNREASVQGARGWLLERKQKLQNRERQAHEESVQRQRRELEKLDGRLEALSHRQAETRLSLREEREREVALLKKEQGDTLAESERDLQAALSSVEEEREKALSAAEKHRADELSRGYEMERKRWEEADRSREELRRERRAHEETRQRSGTDEGLASADSSHAESASSRSPGNDCLDESGD